MEELSPIQDVDEIPVMQRASLLRAQELYQNDPLLVLLKDRLALNSFMLLAIGIVVGSVFFYGLYILPGTGHGLANQPLFAVLEIATATLLLIAYLWLPEIVATLFHTLWSTGVLKEPVSGEDATTFYAHFCKELQKWMNQPVWPIGAAVFIIIYLLNRFIVSGPPFLNYVPFWLQLTTAVIDGLIAYTAVLSIIRLLIALIAMNRIFHLFTIYINPLHPDDVGGLGIMGSIVWLSVCIMLATTLSFLQTIELLTHRSIFSSTLDLLVLIVVYIVVTPVVILGWLVTPHGVMVKARDAVLKPLVDEFAAILDHPQQLTKEDVTSILADNDRLSAIKRRYDLIIDMFPIWPIEVKQIRRIIATLTLPALLSVIPNIIDFVNLILKRM
ncbi:hypothetical protein [Dictyobacter formicarum]|uniref:Yip1 domain-containing protein n=1 Tax=Dictyobacter formicarum TaxID=2778368 RepID=A0ABQ3VFG9_9CHLR|nr:hypothetical protein [Dictyobacter formicarum]GHO84917.1 hypothetical protein KSZ_29230 [Dictyobacter formicarum]